MGLYDCRADSKPVWRWSDIHSFHGWKAVGGALEIGKPSPLRDYLKMVYLDVSPYTLSSVQFSRDLGCDTRLDARTLPAELNPPIASDATPGAHRLTDGHSCRHCTAHKRCARFAFSKKLRSTSSQCPSCAQRGIPKSWRGRGY